MTFLIAIVATYLVPILKNKLHEDKYAQLLAVIEVAVNAAEQTIKGSGMGVTKKEEVIIFLNDWMYRNHFSISKEQLDALVEAAVFEMNKYYK